MQNLQNLDANQQHENSNADVQIIQDYPPNNYQPQNNVVMPEYPFYYMPYNDLRIYHITCKETLFEVVSQLLSNHDRLTQNHAQSSNSHVFYYQHPDDKKIYQVICEMVSYTFIIRWMNKINYGIELNNLNEQLQENLDFSKEAKENLEFYLKKDLIYYLPNEQLNMNFEQDTFIDINDMGGSDITQQDIVDNHIFNQSFASEDHSDQGYI